MSPGRRWTKLTGRNGHTRVLIGPGSRVPDPSLHPQPPTAEVGVTGWCPSVASGPGVR